MKKFSKFPKRILSLLLIAIMVMTVMPSNGLLLIASADGSLAIADGLAEYNETTSPPASAPEETPVEDNQENTQQPAAEPPADIDGVINDGAPVDTTPENIPAEPENDNTLNTGEGSETSPISIFQLSIHYVYGESAGALNGTAASQSYFASLSQGTPYAVESPVISGFTASMLKVEGTLESDSTVTVVYNTDTAVNYSVNHIYQGLKGDGSDNEIVSEVHSGLLGETTNAQAKNKAGFTAGSITQASIAPNGGTEIDIQYTRNEYQVLFSTNGGSYVDTQIKKFGENVSLSTENVTHPKKAGYTFDNWYSDENCTTMANVSFEMPASDIILYAGWKDDMAKYTAVLWMEQADPQTPGGKDYGFDFLYSADLSSTVKSKITTTDAFNEIKSKNLVTIPDIYTFDAATQGNEQFINSLSGTGEEIINVYLKRKEVTVNFNVVNQVPNYDNAISCLLYSVPSEGTHNEDGTHKYFSDRNHSSFEYGAPCKMINSKWCRPSSFDKVVSTYIAVTGRAGELFGVAQNKAWPDTVNGAAVQWRDTDTENAAGGGISVYCPKMERMPLTNRTLTAETILPTAKLYQIFYCLEMLPEDTSVPDRIYKNKNYKFYPIVKDFWATSTMAINDSDSNGVLEISGFTYTRGNYEDFDKDFSKDEHKAYIYKDRMRATISFTSPGSDAYNMPQNITKLFDQKTGVPSDPKRAGYVFAGWNTDSSGNGKVFNFDQNTTMPAGGAALYAMWTPVVYDVTIDLNYAGAPSNTVQKVPNQKTVTPPNVPKRNGYKFTGWYTGAQNAADRYVFDKPVSSSFTIYAHWVEETIADYTVKHVSNGTVLYTETFKNVLVGTTVTAQAKSFEGYAPTITAKSHRIVAGINEIVIEYKPFAFLPYGIAYRDIETDALLEPIVKNDTNKNSIVTVNAKDFEGYTPDELRKTLHLVSEDGIQMNLITFFYTKNKPGYYKVEHYVADDNNEYKLQKTDLPQELAVGKKAVASAMPITSHVRNTDMGLAEGTIMPEHREPDNALVLTVYYDWKTNNITYMPNNTVPGNEAFAQSVKYGKNAVAPENNFTAEDRKVFLGWSENSNASTPDYQPNETLSNITAPKTLYAVWGAEAQYAIKYHANNGGTGVQIYDGGKYYVDETPSAALLSVTKFVAPSGKKFIGWGKTANGNVAYSETAPITIDGNADINLYALWADMNKNTITYNGGTIDGSSGKLVGGETSWVDERFENIAGKVASNKFINDGYKFIGWVDAQGNTWATNAEVPAGMSIELTAKWVKDDAQWVMVNYDANGGINAPPSQEYKRSQLEAVLAPKGSMSHSTNIFGGWSLTPITPILTKAEYDAAQANIISTIDLTDLQYVTYTVYAVWYVDVNGPDNKDDGTADALQYKMLYNGNKNTSGIPPIDANLYNEGDKAKVKQTDMLRTNAVFIGWSTQAVELITTQDEENAVKADGKFFLPDADYTLPSAADSTLYAVWAKDSNGDKDPDYKQFTITYLPGEGVVTGTTEDNNLYSAGTETLLEANGFLREDYMFIGWKNGATIAKPNDPYTVNGNVEFTAQWKLDKNGPDGGPDGIPDEDEYSVTYNANGGTGPVPVNGNIYPEGYSDTPVYFTPKPSKPGHEFLGWATTNNAIAPDFIEGVTETFAMPNKNVTLYAVYSVNTVVYNVRYVSVLNTAEKELAVDTGLTGNFGDKLTLAAKDFKGYTLTVPASQEVTLGNSADNNFVFYYAPVQVQLISEYRNAADNAEIALSQDHGNNYFFGEEYTINSKLVEGYVARDTEKTITISSETKQTVVFLYDINVYTVTFKANNTIVGNDDKNVSVNHGASTKALAADTFTAEYGKEFLGWNTNALATTVEYAADQDITNITGNTTLYAVWGNKAQYTLTYHANNGNLGTQTFDGGKHYDDASPVAATIAQAGFTAPEGKKFTGWSKTEGGNVDYSAGSIISMSDAADLDLYAVWLSKSENTITYNGGTIDGSAGKTADGKTTIVESRYEDAAGKVAKNQFINDGYMFTGWVDAQNKSWAADDVVAAGTDLVLTATWAKDNAQWGKLIYDANGGTNPPAEKEYKLSVGSVDLITGQGSTINPATPNVIFGGWASQRFAPVATRAEYDVAMAKVVTNVKLAAGNNTVYAVWLIDVNGPTGQPDTTPDALQFKVTYLPGAIGVTGATEDTNLYSANYEATLLNNGFVYTENIFAGWSVKNQTKLPGDKLVITGNTDVTALWKPDKNGPDGQPDQIPDEEEYSVVYYANGGTGEVPKDTNIYPVNYSAPVKFDVKPVKEGYAFLGWDTSSSATTPQFKQGGTETVAMVKDGVKLYAIYEASDVSYNVKYVSRRTNSEGVQVERTLEEELNLPGQFDKVLTLTAKEFTGYTLKGNAQQTVTLKLSGNEFVFYYEPNPAQVTSRYLEVGTDRELLPQKDWGSSYQFGVSYSINAASIVGFTPNESTINFKINSDKHDVVFYYTRNQYDYEVRYETADGTTLVVPTKGNAAFETRITAAPVAVTGYTSRSASLSMVIGTDITKNVIIFIYDANPPTVIPPVDPPVTPPETPPVGPITPVETPEVVETPPEEIEIPEEDIALEPGTDVPGPVEIIDDEETALTAAPAAWALLNLLLAILTSLIMVLLFVWYFIGKKKDDDKEKNKQNAQSQQNAQATENVNANKDEKDNLKRKGWMRLLSIIPTIAAIVLFILTENMLNPMVWIDRWTIWMAVIALVQIVVALFCRKKREDNNKDDSDKDMPKTNLAQQNA